MRRIAVLIAVALSLAACTLEPEIVEVEKIVEVEVEKIVEVPTPAALPASCSILLAGTVNEGPGLVDAYRTNVLRIETAVTRLRRDARFLTDVGDFRRLSTTKAKELAGVLNAHVDPWTDQGEVMAKIADVEEARYLAAAGCIADLIEQGAWPEPSE